VKCISLESFVLEKEGLNVSESHVQPNPSMRHGKTKRMTQQREQQNPSREFALQLPTWWRSVGVRAELHLWCTARLRNRFAEFGSSQKPSCGSSQCDSCRKHDV
jgi:uncharacterized protein (DUF3084 family)